MAQMLVTEIMAEIIESISHHLDNNDRDLSYFDDLDDCNKLLEIIKDGNNLNLCDEQQNTIVLYACKFESVKAVKLLIEQPFIRLDVENSNNFDRIPLHVAANYNKSPAIIKLLIEAGCDVNKKDDCNQTALHYIISNSNDFAVKIEMCRLMFESGFDITKIDNFYLLQSILEWSNKINCDEKCSRFKDYLNFISMFLYYNIDVNCRNPHDDLTQPFQIVLSNGIHAVTDLFIDYIDDFTCTSLHYSYLKLAIQYEYPRVSEIVNKGADINFMDARGRSFLHETLECKNNQLFKYFWKHCNLNEILERNETFFENVFECTTNYSSENLLETIYIILESKYALQLLEYSSRNKNIYSDLVKMFSERGYSQEERLKILYTILSINNEISSKDLRTIYEAFGFNEEFEAFLIVNARVFEDLSYNPRFVSNYDRYLHIINPHLKMNYMHFPSLMELSRDSFRANLKKKTDSDSICLDFYSKIQNMKLPKKIEDMIVLRKHLSEYYCEVSLPILRLTNQGRAFVRCVRRWRLARQLKPL